MKQLILIAMVALLLNGCMTSGGISTTDSDNNASDIPGLVSLEGVQQDQTVDIYGIEWRVVSVYTAATSELCKQLISVSGKKQKRLACKNPQGWSYVDQVLVN